MIELIEKLPENLSAQLTSDEPQSDSDAVKFVLTGVKIGLDSADLQYDGSEDHETFKRLKDDVQGQEGTIYLTSTYILYTYMYLMYSELIWFNEEKKMGLLFDYTSIVLHALMNENQTDSSSPSLFLQVEAGQIALPDETKLFEEDYDEADEDDCLTWDLNLDIGSKEVAETIFQVITECSASQLLEGSDHSGAAE